MSRTGRVPLATLERWTATAFVLAALAALGSVATHHLETAGYLTTPVWVNGILTNLTYGAASVGLAGVASRAADRAPRLSQAGLLAVSGVVLSVLAADVGRLVAGTDGPFVVMLAVSLLFYAATTLAFLLLGLACLRTPALARTLGVPLLVVAGARLVTVAGGVLGQPWLMSVGGVGFALPLLVVGFRLWTGHGSPAPGSGTSDAAS